MRRILGDGRVADEGIREFALGPFFLSFSSSKIRATQGVAEGNRRTQEGGKSCGLYFGTGGDRLPQNLHPSPALCVLDIATVVGAVQSDL